MTVVCAFVEQYDVNNNLVSRKWSPILSSSVTLAGERSLDTAVITLPASTVVNQGDVVKYVQDIVDTNFLYGIWNFQDTLRDESGYDQDGTTVNLVARYNQNPPERKMLKFNALLNDQVKIPDATIPKAVIDFSNQFDIIMLIKPDVTSQVCTFFSKSDGSTKGIEMGIQSGLSPQYIYMELYTGSVLTTITGSHVDLRDGGFHWVRVKRDGANLLTVTVDGTTEYSNTFSGDLTNSTNLVFGNNFGNGSRHYNGYIAHARIYCGGTLSDADYTTVISSREQPLTMKFAGYVWNQSTDSATKTTKVQAFSKLLPSIIVDPTVASNIYSSTTYSAIISDLLTNYMSGWEYINDAGALAGDFTLTVGGVLKTLNTDYTVAINTTSFPYVATVTSVTGHNFASGSNNITVSYYYNNGGTLTKVNDTFSGTNTTNQVLTLSQVPNFITGFYVANDTLLSNLLTFTTLNNAFFSTTARKTIIAESRDQDHTDIVFSNGKRFTVTSGGQDQTMLVNDLEVIGGNALTHTSQTFSGSGSAGQTFTLSHVPYSYTVSIGASVKQLGVDYTMNQSTGVITTLRAFTSGTNNVTVDYYYEGTNYVYRVQDSASQLANSGVYSQSITLRGISDLPTITQFATAYLNKYKNVNQRIQVNSPYLINSIRPNYKVTVNNAQNTFNGALTYDSTTKTNTGTFTITTITWNYPQCTTIIQLGSFLFDSYDIANKSQIKVNQTYQQAVKTNNT